MDTTDPEILFDELGVCNHCRDFDSLQALQIKTGDEGAALLAAKITEIKELGRGKRYDCIIGLSGGVDSSYVAFKVLELGLRPLAVHVDTGWNSELAVNNIERIVKKLGIDLETFVVDWREMQDLQLAYFRAGVANCDVPQDHAFVAVLYELAAKNGIRSVISGHNLATESILPDAWGYTSIDRKNLRAIHRAFGNRPLRKYPSYSLFQYTLWWPYVKNLKIFPILNYMEYHKENVKSWLVSELGWRDYGGKHYESRFTKFFQSYYLPTKFGFDKRKAHLSSLVVSGQLTREQALQELNIPLYDQEMIAEDKSYIAKKLGISSIDLDEMISGPKRKYSDFPNSFAFIEGMLRLKKHLRTKWGR